MSEITGTWRIGALARATGLTVRALRHYHAIGLVIPSHLSKAGHRLYGRRDVERLQQVQSLKQLGLSLAEIRECLSGRWLSARRILDLHLNRAKSTLLAQSKLVKRLDSLRSRLETSDQVPVDDFVKLVEAITISERYFTESQLDFLRRRRKILGEARMRRLENDEWPKLIADVKAAMDQGVRPDSARARALAARWKSLGQVFTGGDAAINAAIERMYTEEDPNPAQRHGVPLSREMIAYIGKAMGGGTSMR